MDEPAAIPLPDKVVDVKPEIKPGPVVEPEPMSPADRLRAFEDAHELPRHGGAIERGVGSKFQSDVEGWGDKQRTHHAALEALVTAESENQAAIQAAAIAQAKLDAAAARAAETEKDA